SVIRPPPTEPHMPLYWLCYRHNNQISVVIEAGAPSAGPGIGSGPKRLGPFVPFALPSQIVPTNSAIFWMPFDKPGIDGNDVPKPDVPKPRRSINPSSHHPEMSKSCSLFTTTASKDTPHNKPQKPQSRATFQ